MEASELIGIKPCAAGSPNTDTRHRDVHAGCGVFRTGCLHLPRVRMATLFSGAATVDHHGQPQRRRRQIALRGWAAAANTGAASLVLAKPIGTVDGRRAAGGGDRPWHDRPSPRQAGWTLVRTDTRGHGHAPGGLRARRAAGEPASYTWTFSQAANGGRHGRRLHAAWTPPTRSWTTSARLGGFVLNHHGAIGDDHQWPTLGWSRSSASLARQHQPVRAACSSARTRDRRSRTPEKMTAELADDLRAAVGATGSRVATAAKTGGNIGQLVALRRGSLIASAHQESVAAARPSRRHRPTIAVP